MSGCALNENFHASFLEAAEVLDGQSSRISAVFTAGRQQTHAVFFG